MFGDFNEAIVGVTAHRPWPMPSRPWLMTQTWTDLLFAHWRVEVDWMRAAVPAAFDLDTFDGSAWVGVVPFLMSNVAIRAVPPIPGVSRFPELNVRTYVTREGKPGVYFFSLDAGSRLAVLGARLGLNLPYFHATMHLRSVGPGVAFASRRRPRYGGTPAFTASYEPMGPAFQAAPASLDAFLTERYCLYGLTRRGRPYRLDIHHPPWPLQRARGVVDAAELVAAARLPRPIGPPVLHMARRQDVVAWWPTRVPVP